MPLGLNQGATWPRYYSRHDDPRAEFAKFPGRDGKDYYDVNGNDLQHNDGTRWVTGPSTIATTSGVGNRRTAPALTQDDIADADDTPDEVARLVRHGTLHAKSRELWTGPSSSLSSLSGLGSEPGSPKLRAAPLPWEHPFWSPPQRNGTGERGEYTPRESPPSWPSSCLHSEPGSPELGGAPLGEQLSGPPPFMYTSGERGEETSRDPSPPYSSQPWFSDVLYSELERIPRTKTTTTTITTSPQSEVAAQPLDVSPGQSPSPGPSPHPSPRTICIVDGHDAGDHVSLPEMQEISTPEAQLGTRPMLKLLIPDSEEDLDRFYSAQENLVKEGVLGGKRKSSGGETPEIKWAEGKGEEGMLSPWFSRCLFIVVVAVMGEVFRRFVLSLLQLWPFPCLIIMMVMMLMQMM